MLKGQELIDAIYKKAQGTFVGCGDPENSLDLKSQYGGDGPDCVAMCLVTAFHDKYDLIAILQGAIEVLQEKEEM